MSTRIIFLRRAVHIKLALIASVCSLLSAFGEDKPITERASINGIDYAYEIRGKGEPLLLLHGGLMSFDVFEPVMPLFTKGRQVILVDLQGHGRTTLGTRPIRCEAIADDLDALLQKLGLAKADVLGDSFGGSVALRLAIQHPDRVRRLVLVSTPYSSDAWFPEMVIQQRQLGAAMAPMMAETPIFKTYKAVAPNKGVAH